MGGSTLCNAESPGSDASVGTRQHSVLGVALGTLLHARQASRELFGMPPILQAAEGDES